MTNHHWFFLDIDVNWHCIVCPCYNTEPRFTDKFHIGCYEITQEDFDMIYDNHELRRMYCYINNYKRRDI